MIHLWGNGKGERARKRSNPSHQWTEREDNFIKSNLGRLSTPEMAEVLGHSVSAVRGRIYRLRRSGFLPSGGVSKEWSADDDLWLLENYTPSDVDEIAKRLGRTRRAIYNRISLLRRKNVTHLAKSHTAEKASKLSRMVNSGRESD